jgi:hypothetical protein
MAKSNCIPLDHTGELLLATAAELHGAEGLGWLLWLE